MLIAACDTFRAGAVEQLRTHQRRLNSLHPPEQHGGRPVVQLYEKGYGKDAAGIAMEAIAYGKRFKHEVHLSGEYGALFVIDSTSVYCMSVVKKRCRVMENGTGDLNLYFCSDKLLHFVLCMSISPFPIIINITNKVTCIPSVFYASSPQPRL